VQSQLAANRSKFQAYNQAGPVFPNGLYCEVVGTGFARWCVDLD
jgi:hypothetical protein